MAAVLDDGGITREQAIAELHRRKQESAEPTPEQKAALDELARRRLRHFIPQAWTEVLEPATPYKRNWHIDAMCEHLEAVTTGQIKRLLINVPPGYSKSRTVTVAWPCWEWIRAPHLRYQCFSYSSDLSTDHNMERRSIVVSDWYQRLAPHVKIAGDDNRKTQFSNAFKGKMMATSFGGTATGKGGERLVIDDPLNPKQAASETELKGAEKFFRQTIQSRLRDKKGGAIVIVMQRLHELDTAALALDMGYEHLLIPAEYEPARSKVTVLGWKDPRTKPGEILWPEHEGREEIEVMKVALGPYAYNGQYQQRPHPEEGGIFKKAWFRYYDAKELAFKGRGIRFGAVDLACSEKQAADYTVITSWALIDGQLYLLDMDRRRIEAPDIVPAIRQACERNQLDQVWIERTGFQLAIVQQARRERLPVMELLPDKDKVSRAYAAVPSFARGDVFFPAGVGWLSDLEGELLAFPNAAHDDIVDSVVYGVLSCPWGQGRVEFGIRRKSGAPSAGFSRPAGW